MPVQVAVLKLLMQAEVYGQNIMINTNKNYIMLNTV